MRISDLEEFAVMESLGLLAVQMEEGGWLKPKDQKSSTPDPDNPEPEILE